MEQGNDRVVQSGRDGGAVSKAAPALQVEQGVVPKKQRWHVIARSVSAATINITTAQGELAPDDPLYPTLGFHIKMLEMLSTYITERRADKRRISLQNNRRKPGTPMSIQNDRLRRIL